MITEFIKPVSLELDALSEGHQDDISVSTHTVGMKRERSDCGASHLRALSDEVREPAGLQPYR